MAAKRKNDERREPESRDKDGAPRKKRAKGTRPSLIGRNL